MLGDPLPILDLLPSKINEQCFKIIDNVILTQKKYWPILDVNKKLTTSVLYIEQNKSAMEEGNGNSSCEFQTKPEKVSVS